jgi:hypothetical protein
MATGKYRGFPPDDLIRDFLELQRRVKQIMVQAKGSAHYDYTPVWTSDGTQPSLGTSTVVARYQRIASTCIARIAITLDGSITVGTGTYAFSLPFAAGNDAIGDVRLFDSSASARIRGQAFVTAGIDTVGIWVPTSGSPHTLSAFTNTVPFVPASGDSIRVGIAYEVATGS